MQRWYRRAHRSGADRRVGHGVRGNTAVGDRRRLRVETASRAACRLDQQLLVARLALDARAPGVVHGEQAPLAVGHLLGVLVEQLRKVG